jgi:hypothetical protein
MSKRWIVEVTERGSDGIDISWGAQVNYLPEILYIPHLKHSATGLKLSAAIKDDQVQAILFKLNPDYDKHTDDLLRASYP